jgi:hypothetical protein
MALLDVASYGATGTGADDTAAFEAACLAAKPGDRIQVGPGRFGLTRTIKPPCIIEGGDPVNSTIFALPDAQQPLIDIMDKSGCGIVSLGLEGNNTYLTGTGVSTTGAIRFGGATVEVIDIVIHNCRFQKFKADYWVLATSLTPVRGTSILGNKFITKAADTRNVQDYIVALYGNPSGYMFDTIVQRNVIDGEGVNNSICLFGAHRRFDVSHNLVNNPGQATTATDIGYGILLYALGMTVEEALAACPAQGVVSSNVIVNATKAAIYCVRAHGVTINGNGVHGQSHDEDTLLARGGVALAGCGNVSVTGNNLQDCMWGISVSTADAYNDLFISGNRIRSTRGGSPTGIKLSRPLPIDTRVSVTNNDVWIYSGTGKAFDVASLTGGDVVVRNNNSRAATHGLTATSSAHREIGGNTFFAL